MAKPVIRSGRQIEEAAAVNNSKTEDEKNKDEEGEVDFDKLELDMTRRIFADHASREEEIELTTSEVDMRIQKEGGFDQIFQDYFQRGGAEAHGLKAKSSGIGAAASPHGELRHEKYPLLLKMRYNDRGMHVNRDHAKKLRSYLMKLAKTRHLCDVVIYNGARATAGVAMHSIILRAESDLWNYEVEKRAEKKKPDEQIEIRLRADCNQDCFKAILRYMYSGKIDVNIINVLDMQRAAQALQVPEVLSLCNDFLNLLFTGQNIVTLMAALKLMPNGEECELMTLARARITKKMEKASKQTGAFKESAVLYSSFEELKNLVRDPSMKVQGELDKLMMVLNWLNFSRQKRMKYLRELLSLIDFTKMTEAELVSCWDLDEVFRSDNFAKDLILKANLQKVLALNEAITEKHITVDTGTGDLGGARQSKTDMRMGWSDIVKPKPDTDQSS